MTLGRDERETPALERDERETPALGRASEDATLGPCGRKTPEVGGAHGARGRGSQGAGRGARCVDFVSLRLTKSTRLAAAAT